MTRLNPCRRFVSCPNRGNDKCSYFVWIDFELPTRALAMVRNLMDRVDSAERELILTKAKIRRFEQKKLHVCKILMLVVLVMVSLFISKWLFISVNDVKELDFS